MLASLPGYAPRRWADAPPDLTGSAAAAFRAANRAMTATALYAYAMTDFGPEASGDWFATAQTTTSIGVTLSRAAEPVRIEIADRALTHSAKLGGIRFTPGDGAQKLWSLEDAAKAVRLSAFHLTSLEREGQPSRGACRVIASELPLKPGQSYSLALPVTDASGGAAVLLGFAEGTRIVTAAGKRRVEDLQPGEAIWTEGAGFQPLLWRGTQSLPARGLAAPVRLRPGALGPTTDLVLAPEQCVRVASKAGMVLVPAAAFALAGRAEREFGTQVTWHRLLLPGHCLIQAQGLVCDSLWLPDLLAAGRPKDWPSDWPSDWPQGHDTPQSPVLPRLSEEEGARLLA